MLKKKVSKLEFAVLLIWPIVASLLSFLFNAQIYLSLLLFLGVPAVYLSCRHPKLIKKSLLFSVIFSLPAAFLLDYVMEYTNGWAIGRMELPHIWILQHVSLLQIIWLILYSYLIVIYYEAFFDRNVSKSVYARTKDLIILGVGTVCLLIFFHYIAKSALYINFFYLKIGLVAVLLPLLVFWIRTPSVTAKFFKVGSYFFFFTLIYELTALQLGQWSFPARNQFIGHVTLAGSTFPVEELFFWVMISSVAILAYYEYFDDDGK